MQRSLLDTPIRPDDILIDTRGSDGANGFGGKNGLDAAGDYRSNGGNGGNGENGADAGNISMTLTAHDSNDIAKVVIDGGAFYQLPLGKNTPQIYVRANGGNGGDGGGGGTGGQGTQGRRGDDATSNSSASSGGPGGSGGSGGNGGHGGDGGRGGNLTIKVDPKDTDLLMLVEGCDLGGGMYGAGGNGGHGGVGGEGGRGGFGGTFYSYEYDYLGPTAKTTRVTTYKSDGWKGASGPEGSEGCDGGNGQAGDAGKLSIISGEKNYASRYALAVKSMQVSTDDRVWEPGDDSALHEIIFVNCGLMPTPESPVRVSLINNEWIQFNEADAVNLDGSIESGITGSPSQALLFAIRDNQKLAVDTTFSAQAALQLAAELPRVARKFPDVSKKIFNIQIRYPVEISSVALPVAVEKNQAAPFAIAIRNVSSQPIGSSSAGKRKVEIELSAKAKEANYVTFQSDANAVKQRLDQPIRYEIEKLEPGQTAYFTGTLGFEGVTKYSEADLQFSLHLDKVNSAAEDEVIQVRNAHLDVSEQFSMLPYTDITLVINKDISQETVDKWKQMAETLGRKINIWDASLFHGLSYTQKLHDKNSLADMMRAKIMIILDNEFTLDGVKTRASNLLDEQEILQAAKNINVSTYIISDTFDMTRALTPIEKLCQNDPNERATARFFHTNRPTEADIQKQAVDLTEKIQKQHPERRYVPVYKYDPLRNARDMNSYIQKWNLGTVEARETLGLCRPHVAHRQSSSMEPDTLHDLFNIAKLMPFDSKNCCLMLAKNDLAANAVKSAILSDLLDEMTAFAAQKWNGDYDAVRLKSVLSNLKFLSAFGLPGKHLPYVLLHYEYAANRLPDKYDQHLFPMLCRRKTLSKIIQEEVKKLLEKKFPKRDFTEERNYLKKQWDSAPIEKVLESLRYLPHSSTEFDNQSKFGNPVSLFALKPYEKRQSKCKESVIIGNDDASINKTIELEKQQCRFELK